MKLLFDQNISFRIIKMISEQFPDAKQLRELQLENFTDLQIWEYARDNDYAIVTFDADFFDLSNLFGHPPKIIWLRTGNRKTNALAELICSKSEIIKEFITNKYYEDIACIEIE
jgi:predicted nuclease of predicted toxin-antitoxin system